jgi:hypothetical protein
MTLRLRYCTWVLRRLRAARAGLMNGADRKAIKSELKAALRAKARGLPLSPHAEAAMLWVAWLKRTEGDQAIRRLLAISSLVAAK